MNKTIQNDPNVNRKILIVGLTGTLGAGKGTIAEILMNVATQNGLNYIYESLSDEIRNELNRLDIEVNRDTQKEIANKYRSELGSNIWAQIAARKVLLNLAEFPLSDKVLIVVDAIRNPAEVQELRWIFREQFILLGIVASKDKITENILKRRRQDESTRALIDSRELNNLVDGEMGSGQPDYGIQVLDCLKIADLIIENVGSLEMLREKVMVIAHNLILPRLG